MQNNCCSYILPNVDLGKEDQSDLTRPLARRDDDKPMVTCTSLLRCGRKMIDVFAKKCTKLIVEFDCKMDC